MDGEGFLEDVEGLRHGDRLLVGVEAVAVFVVAGCEEGRGEVEENTQDCCAVEEHLLWPVAFRSGDREMTSKCRNHMELATGANVGPFLIGKRMSQMRDPGQRLWRSVQRSTCGCPLFYTGFA